MATRTPAHPPRAAALEPPRRSPVAWPGGLRPVAALGAMAWGDDPPEPVPGPVGTSRSGVRRIVWPAAVMVTDEVRPTAPARVLDATLELTLDGLALITLRDLPLAWLDAAGRALAPGADGYLEARGRGTLWRIDLVDRSLTLEADPEQSEEEIL